MRKTIVIIKRLAVSQSEIKYFQLDQPFISKMLSGEYVRDIGCTVPGCPIHSREISSLYAIDPRLMGYTIIPLCRVHAKQAVEEDDSLTFGELPYALALAHQGITGRRLPLIEIPPAAFRGLERPGFEQLSRVSIRDMVAPRIKGRLQRKVKNP